MNKKYCKNCKYSGGWVANSISSGWKWCEAPQLTENKGSKYSGYYGSKKPIYKSELNLDGNCPYYKCKFWKFWVK